MLWCFTIWPYCLPLTIALQIKKNNAVEDSKKAYMYSIKKLPVGRKQWIRDVSEFKSRLSNILSPWMYLGLSIGTCALVTLCEVSQREYSQSDCEHMNWCTPLPGTRPICVIADHWSCPKAFPFTECALRDMVLLLFRLVTLPPLLQTDFVNE